MISFGGWEQLEPLGEGGQSKVFLVRSPGRIQERKDVIQEVLGSNPWTVRMDEKERPERIDRLATALSKYSRPDKPSELGALKMFKIPTDSPDAEEAVERLRNEIVVLGQNRPGLVKLLAASEKERWMVTEYLQSGSMNRNPGAYKGDAGRALKAFRSLVETVASLHKNDIVHRDIKPANVFPTDDERLILAGC
jgi:serine/threonine protein kinase